MLPQKVDLILNTINHLRPMPTSVTRILKEIDEPNVAINLIADYIGMDQALAALVLQMSNSAEMGFSDQVVSLQSAVMRIGLKRLKSILLASPAIGSLNRRLIGYRLGSGELWQHSVATASASEWLARALSYPNPEEAYVSGLIHDIGKLLLDQFVFTDYTKIVEFMHRYQMPLWQVEEKLIGMDHAGVGGLIAERWKFPVSLTDAIRYHHYPSLARINANLPAIVNLANSISTRILITDSEIFTSEIHPETFVILNLSEDEAEKITKELIAYLSNVRA
ncbi:MAG: HDOD domain-containing protein [Anaerolineaceae bacterium]|nr:HDOD domain-containing protein [Anaerolineaceae bacterium]